MSSNVLPANIQVISSNDTEGGDTGSFFKGGFKDCSGPDSNDSEQKILLKSVNSYDESQYTVEIQKVPDHKNQSPMK